MLMLSSISIINKKTSISQNNQYIKEEEEGYG